MQDYKENLLSPTTYGTLMKLKLSILMQRTAIFCEACLWFAYFMSLSPKADGIREGKVIISAIAG